jgi:hypothetical protein
MNRVGGLTAVGGSLTARFWVMHELTSVALDCSSERDPVGKSSFKSCSKSARPPKTSQAATVDEERMRLGFKRDN